MALQVWLPLNGNLDNQGLYDFTFNNSGAVIDNNGKIGKCYSLDGSSSYLYSVHDKTIWNHKPISIAVWFKCDQNRSSGIIVDIAADMDLGYYYNSNGIRFFYWRSWLNGSTRTGDTYVDSTYYDATKWHHAAYVADGPMNYIYVDGQLSKSWDSSSKYTDNFIPLLGASYNRITIGTSAGNPNNRANGLVNDIRIYDHALSPREIKELSKGMILHYPLAMPGQENIIANTSHEIACTYPASGVKDYYSVKTKSVPNETQYTLSFEARSTVDGDHLRTHFYSPNTTTTCESSQGIIKTASDGNMDFTLTTEWRRYWVVYTQTETTARKSVICPRLCSPASYPSSQSGTGTVYVRNQKLEHGSHPTPWIPNPTDAEYSALGFNDGIEYDVSGYEHNGTKVGAVVASADTPRYSTSSSFDGSSYIINSTSTIHLSNEFTIAWWGKVNSWQKKWEGMFLLQNTPALQSGSNVDRILSCLHGSTQGVMDLAIGQAGGNAGFDHYSWPYIIGEWAYYACTYKAGVVRMYKDGEQTYTATIQDNSSNDYYFTIGRRNSNCDCQMSDFRIYNTALSADDVTKLYNGTI